MSESTEKKAEAVLKEMTEARDALKSARENGATKDEVKSLEDRVINTVEEKFKAVEEQMAEDRKKARVTERKENLEGITAKGLRDFNASRKGQKRLTLDEAISYTKAWEAACAKGEEHEYRVSHLDEESKKHFADINKALTGASGSGGALVAPAFASDVEQVVRDSNDFMAHCRTIRVGSQNGGNTVQRILNGKAGTAWESLTNTSASGGSDSPASAKSDVRVRNLISVQELSMDIVESAEFSPSDYLVEPVGMDMALAIEQAMISTGTGDTGMNPEALINATLINDNTNSTPGVDNITVSDYFGNFASVNSGTANNITQTSTVDVTNTLGMMPSTLQMGYRRNGRWFMNAKTLARIALFKDTQGQYILQNSQASNSSNPLNPNLFGYPVSICESFPDHDVANNFPLCFGSMYRGYTIAMGRGMRMKIDETSAFSATRYLFSQRIGGAPFDPEALLFMKVSA